MSRKMRFRTGCDESRERNKDTPAYSKKIVGQKWIQKNQTKLLKKKMQVCP